MQGRRARCGRSDSALSPAGTRLRIGDDRWSPPVIGCGRGIGDSGAGRRAAGPAGPQARDVEEGAGPRLAQATAGPLAGHCGLAAALG
jgi:hypothetical protein